ncbi:hypothetical protein EV363DRAFT_1469053 [Boletus edulis]|nr:hypothetical protein EV363DRAFT_1469053 [Boletus edulis]
MSQPNRCRTSTKSQQTARTSPARQEVAQMQLVGSDGHADAPTESESTTDVPGAPKGVQDELEDLSGGTGGRNDSEPDGKPPDCAETTSWRAIQATVDKMATTAQRTVPTANAKWANRPNEPLSVELEGPIDVHHGDPPGGVVPIRDRKKSASCKDELTSDKTDASGASERDEDARERYREYSPRETRGEPVDPDDDADMSGASNGDEDPRDRPKILQNVSEQIRERLERARGGNSHGRAQDEPDKPDCEAAAPADVHSHQERPRSVRNNGDNETNAQN